MPGPLAGTEACNVSTHSLLAEGDSAPGATVPRVIRFQPTPSSRRETIRSWGNRTACYPVSTHSLLAEGDSKTRQSFSPSIGEILQTHFFFFVPRTLFSLFPSKRWLFPVRTSLAFHVRFRFAPARHTISTSSG